MPIESSEHQNGPRWRTERGQHIDHHDKDHEREIGHRVILRGTVWHYRPSAERPRRSGVMFGIVGVRYRITWGVALKHRSFTMVALIVMMNWPGATSASIGAGGATSQPNHLATTWRSTSLTTTSRSFHQVPGLGGRYCARGALTLTFSASVAGASAAFEVLIDDGPRADPGIVTFSPSNAAASFTFVANAQPFEANDHHVYQVWWRSPSGRATTVRVATLTALYQLGTKTC